MKITNPEALMAASISRRSLVKTSAIGSLALASSAFTLPFSRIAHAAADLASGNVAEKAVWSSCTVVMIHQRYDKNRERMEENGI
ncbi:twin-arginine translocation signal domain-containing protein [Salmonella enterica]|nr:twin-arginine translocation signal domain-containing protein [Salmonella enterica]